MSLSTDFDRHMTAAIYAAMGEDVSYTAGSATAQIKCIVRRGDAEFPVGYESPGAAGNDSVRVLVADVAMPSRGDTITDADGDVYTVDSVQRLNLSEWVIEVRRG